MAVEPPVRGFFQDSMGVQRQACPAAAQPQLGPQAHAWFATGADCGAVLTAWQPQVQPAPGQATHWHETAEAVEATFMEIS